MRQYLVKLREENNLTQQNVADEIGISRQYYAMVENGERQNKMDITLVTKLASVFHIALTDFIAAETDWQGNNNATH